MDVSDTFEVKILQMFSRYATFEFPADKLG